MARAPAVSGRGCVARDAYIKILQRMTKNCSQTGTKFPKFGRTIWKFPFPDHRRIIEGEAYGRAYGTGLQLVGGFAPKPRVGVLTNNVNDDQFFTIYGTFRLTKFGTDNLKFPILDRRRIIEGDTVQHVWLGTGPAPVRLTCC